MLAATGGKVVLVGDPKQLPATVLSRAAQAKLLSQSLFERLQQVAASLSRLLIHSLMGLRNAPEILKQACSAHETVISVKSITWEVFVIRHAAKLGPCCPSIYLFIGVPVASSC